MKKEDAIKPILCPDCSKIIDSNNLEWVLCGGQTVGLSKPNYIWRLRYKDEDLTIAQRTKDLQRLAGASRLLHEASKCINDPILKEKIEKFFKSR